MESRSRANPSDLSRSGSGKVCQRLWVARSDPTSRRFYNGKYRLPREIHEMDIISRGRGFDSNSDDEFVRFLRYALRSGTEVQSHLYVAVDQKYISEGNFDDLYKQATEVKKKISGFIRYLRN